VKLEQVRVYAGSSEPLHTRLAAFACAARRSYGTADPGYESRNVPPQRRRTRRRLLKVPDEKLRPRCEGDAGAAPMRACDVCTPHTPTGTDQSFRYRITCQNKQGSLLLVTQVYSFCRRGFCDGLVKAGKDLILIRTCLERFGMAGLRGGAVFGRPDCGENRKLWRRGGKFHAITALAAAGPSLKEARDRAGA